MKEKLKTFWEKVVTFFKDRPQIITFLSYILVAVAASMLTLALTLTTTQNPTGQSKLDVLQQLIDDRFIGEVDITKLEDMAANAMIQSLGDRWSFYIPKSEMEGYEQQKNNAYVGIGVTITQMEDGSGLKVTQVTIGGSAEEAGVLAGDIITAVDGKSILEMTLDGVGQLIKGESGTQVVLTVLRNGEQMQITVTRRQIKMPVAVPTMLENNIGLIQIKNFNTNCTKETVAAIKLLQAQGAEKLIFDVRFNGGGYAHEMVALLDYLLPEGELFKTVDYTGKETVEKSNASYLDMPMAVLVNGSSYSAAEFFAAALDEYDAAVVVGEQTSGKGYFQVTYALPDGSAVALSIGKYYTPQGKSLEGVGITPEFVVPVDEKTAAGIYAGTIAPMDDPQILKAIEALEAK
jgi:carboxyl-terminal processing protease